jgi:hypothetical protein
MQEPSLGRIVHYKSYGTPNGEYESEPRAAMITKVHGDDVVDIAVFNPTGIFFTRNVTCGEDSGQWSWPPRV